MATPAGQGATAPVSSRVEVLGNIGPNWFASVMGTGIVATAGATLPVHVPGLRGFTEVVWVIAAILLTVLIARGRRPLAATSHGGPQLMRATRRWPTSTARHPWHC